MTVERQDAPKTLIEHALYYIGLGWGLCRIPVGTKGPHDSSWNQPRLYIDSTEKAIAQLSGQNEYGLGLIHSSAGTCAIDVDSAPYFRIILAEFGLDCDELFNGAPRIVGREHRDKAIFKLPADVPAQTHKLVWPANSSDAKPITVFEFRAGTVQDVLPPSIHPDLQQPYSWRVSPWEIDEIPELPRPLAEIWRNWAALKPQLESVCPWSKQKPLPPTTHRRASGVKSQDVIGKFCAAHDLRTMLAHYGYVSKGRRYLAPTSSTGLAGVTIFEGGTHCYSHHAADPLSDGHRHDAFDLFCKFEHHGDVAAAVRNAAAMLGVEYSNESPAEVDQKLYDKAHKLIENTKRKAAKPKPSVSAEPIVLRKPDVDAPPNELLVLPGTLGDFVNYVNETAPKPQPLFAITSALALGSTVLGRRWTNSLNTWSPLYFVNVGKSACGKEHARTAIERVLIAAKMQHLLGPSGYTSDGAVFSALLHQPAHIAVIDEFGDMLTSAKSDGNFYKRQAMSLLLETWGRVGGTLRPSGYSTMTLSADQAKEIAKRCVERPALTILGMTTPESFYSSLDESSIRGGFLNRLLIVETNIGRQDFGDFTNKEPPASVIDWCRAARNVGEGDLRGLELGPEITPTANTVDIECHAKDVWRAYASDCRKAMDELDAIGLGELEGRSAEKAMRIAQTLAVSENIGSPMIRTRNVDWAISFVRFSTNQTIAACRARMHGSKLEAAASRVLEFITCNGRVNTKILLQNCRSFSSLDRRQREEVLLTLQDADRIESVNPEEIQSRGRPGKWFKAVDQAA